MTSNCNISDAEPLIFTNYESTLHQVFGEMFWKKELADAVLICDNRRIDVHKFILSASSSFFNNIFKKSNVNSLTISNVNRHDLYNVLQYIYTGQVKVQPYQVSSFIDATNKLSVPISCDELKDISINHGLSLTRSQPQDCQSSTLYRGILVLFDSNAFTILVIPLDADEGGRNQIPDSKGSNANKKFQIVSNH